MHEIFTQRTGNSWTTWSDQRIFFYLLINFDSIEVHAAIDGAKSEGISEVFSMGLSNYSQRIFRNMGFNERASIDYVDYKQARI